MRLHTLFLTGLLLSSTCYLAEAAGRTMQDCADCPVMVVIPAGKFMMGDAGNPSTMPVHHVELNYQFAIGQTEVTEAQFRIFLKRTGYNAGPAHLTASFSPKLPALELDWYAASAYARWLSRYTGKRYRLPSEAEWDYAAHAGQSSRYWWGNSAVDGCGKEHLPMTFFRYDQQCATLQKQDTIDVASLRANPWGLYDMLGNAGEWTQDCWKNDYSGVPANGAPFIDANPYSCLRVVRGPSFLESAAHRHLADATERPINTGFRIVRDLP